MQSLKTFFSLVTCTHNSENFIKNNLKSVKSQTFQDYEQIVIDGKSSDKTIQIVKSFQKNNSKIKVFSFPPKGISDAFNEGILKSRGKYIFFLNSDDSFYDKNVLKNVSEFLLQNPKLDWIYGMINVVEENGKSVGVFPKWKIFQISWSYLLKFVNFIPHQAVFMKKEVFDKFGPFDNKLKTGMDYDFWLSVATKTKWKFCDKLISNYMVRRGSSSSDGTKKYVNMVTLETVQKKYLRSLEIIPAKIINRLIMKVNKTYR